MFKRRTIDITGDLLHGEQSVHDAILKLSAARVSAHELLLKWASGEDNPLIFSLFKRLAEIQWMYKEASKKMAEKHLRLSKAFKQIFQEERLLEESRKELQSVSLKITKLQKQIEVVSKKGDQLKKQSLEAELNTQTKIYENLSTSFKSKTQKHELYKINQLKKALIYQAEGVITLSGHCQQLYASQMQLIDLLPDNCQSETSDRTKVINRSMSQVVSKVSQLLDLQPPPNGGVELTPPSENTEKPIHNSTKGGLKLLKQHKSAENVMTDNEPKCQPKEEPVRPEVNYTQGMYCEIVIPEPGLGNGHPTTVVPMRRSMSNSSPNLNRKISSERHRSAIILDSSKEASEALSGALPMDTDSETISIPDTCSDDIPSIGEDMDHNYTMVSILPSPTSQSSTSSSPDINAFDEYARPADVVPFEYTWNQQHRMPKRNLASPPIPEGRSVSSYETIEDIQKLKKEQQNNRRKAHEKNQEVADEHIYSRPFDAINFNCPVKVSTELTMNQVSVPPPVHRPNGKYPIEKAVKTLHQTNGMEEDENGSSQNIHAFLKSSRQRAQSTKSRKVTVSPDNNSSTESKQSGSKKNMNSSEQSAEDSTSNPRFFGRCGSAGSVRHIPTKPIAERINRLRTGQATVHVANSSSLKKPLPLPSKPWQQHQ